LFVLCPDLRIAIVDALRADQITTHHPGETVARIADLAIVNKVDAAPADAAQRAVSRRLDGVTFGAGLFVAVGRKETIIDSADGIDSDTWSRPRRRAAP
jgi:predicted GTPase